VLLIVSALSVAAYLSVETLARSTDAAKLSTRRGDAAWAARSAEAAASVLAKEILTLADGRLADGMPGLGETLTLPTPRGTLMLEINEASNCYNLNRLASVGGDGNDPAIRRDIEGYSGLLTDLGLTDPDARRLTDTLLDWMDADQLMRPSGAEDSIYALRSPPYRTSGQRLESVAELAAIEGYTPEIRERLAPFVCALPVNDQSRLNVNTLTMDQAPLLRAVMSPALGRDLPRQILQSRPAGGWASAEAFEAERLVRSVTPDARDMSRAVVTSSYLHVTARIIFDAGAWPFEFLLSVQPDNRVTVVWRRFGEA
jgi:general secretion pathway protein K